MYVKYLHMQGKFWTRTNSTAKMFKGQKYIISIDKFVLNGFT